MALGKITVNLKALSMTTLSKMLLSIMKPNNDNQHNCKNALVRITVKPIILSAVKLSVTMRSVIMRSVIKLIVIMLTVIMLTVMDP
jgi:hypothetical protein